MRFVIALVAVAAAAAGSWVFTQEKDNSQTCSGKDGAVCASKAGKSCCGSTSAVAIDAGKSCCGSTSAVAIEEGKSCCAGGSAVAKSSCCGGESAAIAAAMAKLPKMTYKVGTETTCCSKSAAAMAEKSDEKIEYLVGEKSFEDQQTAFVALVESTEAFVKDFATPAKCEVSGKTSIAGKSCGCSVEAGQRTELVKTAIDGVKMSYKVGEETVCCSHAADALAKKSDAKIMFVVGDEVTPCNHTARLNLARAQYAAAVKAVSVTDKKAETKVSTKKEAGSSAKEQAGT